jgi:ribulose-phosphate 3-epimerase
MNRIKIAPSILAADHSDLGGEIRRVEEAGADMIHVDVADGHFAPNISMGPDTVRSIRKVTKLPLDVHLMITEPGKFLEPFLNAGSDILTVHGEVVGPEEISRFSKIVRARGKRLGVALKPSSPLPSWFQSQIPNISLLLVLSVNPGFPGQKFMAEVLPKVGAALTLAGPGGIDVEVDGGVDQENAATIVRAGATILVAGASVFRRNDVKSALRELKLAADPTLQEAQT